MVTEVGTSSYELSWGSPGLQASKVPGHLDMQYFLWRQGHIHNLQEEKLAPHLGAL